jgi:Flp pilus assembly protein TadB
MDEQEQALFDRFEKDTNHRFLLKLTENLAKFSWLLVAVAVILVVAKKTGIGYPLLIVALVFLFASFSLGVLADRVRRRIQERVHRELGE